MITNEQFSDIINDLLAHVVEGKIEVDINIEPERFDIQMRPFEPYRIICPYKEGKENQ